MFKKTLLQQIPNLKQSPEKLYRIITSLGKGSIGQVYKGINIVTDQLVAIKILNIETELKDSHVNELCILSSMNHPNIIQLYDVYQSQDQASLWIIMEYCHYGNLSEIIQTTGLTFSESEIACIVHQIIQGLNYCHKIDVMHRDLQNSNILINIEGTIKISDFGLAIKEKQSYQFVGSPYYMSPEQIQKKTYTKSIDIWSLGICIIEMYEGQIPYSDISPINILQIIKNKPRSGFLESSACSAELNLFLSHFLEVNPLDRPQACELLKNPFFEIHSQYMGYIKKNICEVRRIAIEKYKKQQIYKYQSTPPNQSQLGSSVDEYSKVKSYNENNFLQSNDSQDLSNNDSQISQKQQLINRKVSNSCHNQGKTLNNFSINFVRISEPNNQSNKVTRHKKRQSYDSTQNQKTERKVEIKKFLQQQKQNKQNDHKPLFKLQMSKFLEDKDNKDNRLNLSIRKIDTSRTQGTGCSVIMQEQHRNTIRNCKFIVKHNQEDLFGEEIINLNHQSIQLPPSQKSPNNHVNPIIQEMTENLCSDQQIQKYQIKRPRSSTRGVPSIQQTVLKTQKLKLELPQREEEDFKTQAKNRKQSNNSAQGSQDGRQQSGNRYQKRKKNYIFEDFLSAQQKLKCPKDLQNTVYQIFSLPTTTRTERKTSIERKTSNKYQSTNCDSQHITQERDTNRNNRLFSDIFY